MIHLANSLDKVHIVAGANINYAGRIMPYLESLSMHSDADNVLIQVGGQWEYNIPNVHKLHLPREQNAGAPPTTESIQHGSFLQVLEHDPDDMIIYTDGDMTMQRPFTDDEKDWLESFGERTASAGWNQEGETLESVISLIGRFVDMDEVHRRFPGGFQEWPSLNVGVLAMRGSAWRELYDAYMQNWELVSNTFPHQARQQWLICYEIFALKMDFRMMPWSFHAHGHFGMPRGCSNRKNALYSGDEVVLFRHRL